MVPLIGHANIMRYACIQSCRIDVGVVYLMIIRISVQLGLLDMEEKIVYENSIGPSTLPCGTPRLTLSQVEKVSPTLTL